MILWKRKAFFYTGFTVFAVIFVLSKLNVVLRETFSVAPYLRNKMDIFSYDQERFFHRCPLMSEKNARERGWGGGGLKPSSTSMA
jgi:hypothetical protein